MIADEYGEILSDVAPKQVFVRTRYNYDMNAVSDETSLNCTDETKAQQQFRDECDINTIVKNFGVTGMLPINERPVLAGEFADVSDYQEALNKLIEADRVFMTLPADVRREFDNDPGKFVDFASDEKNIDRMREWGMAKPKAVEEVRKPLEVTVVPGSPSTGPGPA